MFQPTNALMLIAAFIAPFLPREIEQKHMAKTAEEVHSRLVSVFNYPGFDPNTPLRDALGFVSERQGLMILVDTQAFKEEMSINEPEQQPVKMPPTASVPLREILRLVCDQANGAFVQTGTVIWVVPKSQVLPR